APPGPRTMGPGGGYETGGVGEVGRPRPDAGGGRGPAVRAEAAPVRLRVCPAGVGPDPGVRPGRGPPGRAGGGGRGRGGAARGGAGGAVRVRRAVRGDGRLPAQAAAPTRGVRPGRRPPAAVAGVVGLAPRGGAGVDRVPYPAVEP